MNTNPFRFGDLVTGERFTDREEEIAGLEADLQAGQNVVVVSPRRFGKTSLLVRVTDRLRRSRVLVAWCDLDLCPTPERLAEHLARTIHRDLASPGERARERAVNVFRNLRVKPTITLDPHTGDAVFGFSAEQAPRDIDSAVEDLLRLPGEIARDRGRRVVLVFDEFQGIVDIDPDYPRLLRSVFQRQPEVAHVYAGSRRSLMHELFQERNQPLYRSAKHVALGPIPRDRFIPFLAERFAAGRVPAEPAALDRLLDITAGHPYATQQLAYFTWDLARARPRPRARVETVDAALVRVVESEDNYYRLLWSDASANQKLVLEALAAEDPGRIFARDYRARHRLPPATNLSRALGGLVEEELVGQTAPRGPYRIEDPFLRAWLRRRAGRDDLI